MTVENKLKRPEQAVFTTEGLFKDTITDLNSCWRECVRYFSEGDCCVSYLRTFEFTLSPNCPDRMLWNFEVYKELEAVQPLPDNMDARVTSKTYFAYMMVYEQIMRKVGLIDKSALSVIDEQIQTGLFKDTITDLNACWRECVRYFSEGDCCVSYLRTFELTLSPNCPDKMLWNFEEYIELEAILPLPDDMDVRVSAQTYMAYMMVYEQIMRKIGLVDKMARGGQNENLELIALGGENGQIDSRADEMFASMVSAGEVWLTSGFKGGGKSHTAIAVSEMLVKGIYPSVGTTYLLTNIIFYHKYKNKLKVEYPPGVFHVETMKDTFWKIYEILSDTEAEGMDRQDINIILVLDEAQNFIGGDNNSSNASVMMKELLGTIRKFRLLIWFLTPSPQSIGPAFRNWLVDPKYPGNLTAQWKKDLGWNTEYIKKNKLNLSPKELMVVKHYDSDAKVVRVPVTQWTKTKETIANGEYCYDHEASATFHVGDDFDWEDFNRVLGGTASIDLLPTIHDYFGRSSEKSEEKEDEKTKVERAVLEIACKLRLQGNSWDYIAKTLDVPRKTLTDRIKRAGMWSEGLENVSQRGKKANSDQIHQENDASSNFGGGQIGGAKLQPKYISKKESALEGVFSPEIAGNPVEFEDYSADVMNDALMHIKQIRARTRTSRTEV